MTTSSSKIPATLQQASEAVRRKTISPLELTRHFLAEIEKRNPALNAFIAVTAEAALAQARLAESEIQRGEWRGPLHGIPLGLKDLIDTAGIPTTAASRVFQHRVPEKDAEVVRRLRESGAIVLGKQNLHEFAYGGSSIIGVFGPVRNPWNPAHIAGGSSAGSAASVAAGLGYAAIGTDTAGSVRQPAALCGIVGLKPTYRLVSARGVIPLSPSLDHVGVFTRTVADAAMVLQEIAGFDPNDPGSGDLAVAEYSVSAAALAGTRIGVPRPFFYDNLDSEVAAAVDQALAVLQSQGARIHEIELDVPSDRTLQAAESFAWHEQFIALNRELYHPETLRRLETGRGISPARLKRLREELARIRDEIGVVFRDLDALVTPTTPIPAPAIADLQSTPDALRPAEIRLLRNTRPFNVWGLPAVSVPCGFTASGLPVGLQIAGPHWAEQRVLQIAHAYEQATPWHRKQCAN